MSADNFEYDIEMAISPEGVDLAQKNNWCYDSSFYRGVFGGIFRLTASNDYSLYLDAVNTDRNGNVTDDGVRIGFYNLSAS